MKLIPQSPKKALKAFLKQKPLRSEIDVFKTNLIALLDKISVIEKQSKDESEEHLKNNLRDFLRDTYYRDTNAINTKDKKDLVIHLNKATDSEIGVIIEAKRPSNRGEMLTADNPNKKALHELILYYLNERHSGNNQLKQLVATSINEWFIIDANLFDKHIYRHPQIKKLYETKLNDRKDNPWFYEEIAKIISNIDVEIPCIYFDIRDYETVLRNNKKEDDKELIALFKILSPQHLLKIATPNDSNALNEHFYKELLHIIGLEEAKEGTKNVIRRKKDNKNDASLIELTIEALKTEDTFHRITDLKVYGETREEQTFNIALELCITWINRILFLKLLEGQLITYHRGNKEYRFLNSETIHDFDELFKLFHKVLAIDIPDRTEAIKTKYSRVPYLNSSLFEISELEDQTIKINSLDNNQQLELINTTVLKDLKKKSGKLPTLNYLFNFLDAYDFASEGTEDVQEDNKTIINASVLGKVFEKINGYKDGSIFTPAFITMYMCRQSIRLAVVQKFNEASTPLLRGAGGVSTPLERGFKTLEDVYEQIGDGRLFTRQQANQIVNSIKICDPAVGSGHFLVSALNEIIAIKNDLKILEDKNGKSLNRYEIEIVNDELIVTDEDGKLFEYKPLSILPGGDRGASESQRVQETLFNEKQTIIENCLFGVDINPKSVLICRLRLWIELLKNAYYIKSSSPNLGEGSGGRRGQEQLNNLPNLKTFRKELRNSLTPAEAKLWTLLKGKQMDGRKFRRQHSVANYILDFYCPEERIAIELDGQGHFETTEAEYDRERDLFLEAFGIRVLRFENKWVWDNPEGLLERVKSYFGKQQPPRPSDTPPSKGGELLELETLPNIDINIKCGNSLLSRFPLDADLSKALKSIKYNIEAYRGFVSDYKNEKSRDVKKGLQKIIDSIKSDFRTAIFNNDPKVIKLSKLKGEQFSILNQGAIFELDSKEKEARKEKLLKLEAEINKLSKEIEEIKTNALYKNAFEWRFEFPEVMDDNGNFVGFDVVIGNPPYIQLQKDGGELANMFEKLGYETFERTGDIYSLFYEKGIQLLAENGILTYISSNKWMRAGYGKSTREFFSRYNPLKLIDLGSGIFNVATVDTNILLIQKAHNQNQCKALDLSKEKNPAPFDSYTWLHLPNQGSNSWTIATDIEQRIKAKIEAIGKPLKEWDVQIYRGILTGYNKAFIIDGKTKDELIAKDPRSAEILKPILRGRDIKRYKAEFADLWLIFVPWHFPLHKDSDIKGASQLAEEEFKKQYLAIYSHLLAHKEKLSARNKVETGLRYEWYALQRWAADYHQEFEKEIICWKAVGRNLTFCLWGLDKYITAPASFVSSNSRTTTVFLLGIFQSKYAQHFILKNADTTGAGDVMLNIQSIEKLFIPQLPESEQRPFVALVEQVIAGKERGEDTTPLERQIDQMVYHLYALTDEEIKIVEANSPVGAKS